MDASSLLLIVSWLFFLWILGWLTLPLARHIFVNLPDGGLAAGRILTLALISLILFWGASLRLVPLMMAPFCLVGIPLVLSVLSLRNSSRRIEFFQWVREHRRALLFSDALFAVIFLFFVWVRLRHPEINDLEKPMDAALIATLMRTSFLPAENPWFSGTPFTNYYYFGHLMGSLLARTLVTPLPIAYNLILPAFCTLFVTALWSLCAALTGSVWRGLAASSMVALLGHFEPLRQWAEPRPGIETNLFRMDWWSASRVITDTINEYPIFTLTIGDAHAHFFALALTCLFFCLCYALFSTDSMRQMAIPLAWLNHRKIVVILLGMVLGTFWMTNTWDLPIYGGLAIICLLWTLSLRGSHAGHVIDEVKPEVVEDTPPQRSKSKKKKSNAAAQNTKQKSESVTTREPQAAVSPTEKTEPLLNLPIELLLVLLPLPLARLVAWPYLRLFEAQVSGAVWEFWSYPALEFGLLWGGFLALWIVVITLVAIQSRRMAIAMLPVLIVVAIILPSTRANLSFVVVSLMLVMTMVMAWICRQDKGKNQAALHINAATSFQMLMALFGLLALMAPMLFYIKGVFGEGQFKHQDTVFKFGIQTWLLLGTAAACGAISLFASVLRERRLWQWPLGFAWAVLWSIPFACAANVVWTRTVRDAPRDPADNFVVSLDGARHISPSDRAAMEWLQRNTKEGDAVLEATEQNAGSAPGGDFKAEYGRVAALTGVATPMAWPTHIMSWGAPWGEIVQRNELIKQVYSWPDDATGLESLRQLRVRYVFVGDTERRIYNAEALARLYTALSPAYSNGDTFIAQIPQSTPP